MHREMKKMLKYVCITHIWLTTSQSVHTRSIAPPSIFTFRCCYITMDFATAALQNGFNAYKLALHKN
jgi:hypothetical protein